MAPVTTRSMAKSDESYVFDRFTPKKRTRTSFRSKLEEAKRQKQLLEQKKEEDKIYTEEELVAHFGADHLTGVRECQRTLDTTCERLLALAAEVEHFLEVTQLTEKVQGDIEAFCGKTRLIVRSKLQKQYQKMVNDALSPTYTPPTKVSDLTGFWEMIELQISQTQNAYEALIQLKQNNWVEPEPVPTKVLKPKIVNKPAVLKATAAKNIEKAKERAEKMRIFREEQRAKKAALEKQLSENTVPMETQ